MFERLRLLAFWKLLLIGAAAGALLTIPAGVAAWKLGRAAGAAEVDQLQKDAIARLKAEKAALAEQLTSDAEAGVNARRERERLRGRVADLELRLADAKARAADPETIIRTVEADNAEFADSDPLYEPVSDGLRRRTEDRRQDYR